MGERKPFLLRVDGALLDAMRAWAEDELRSLNGQIEFLLRKALRDRERERLATTVGGATTKKSEK